MPNPGLICPICMEPCYEGAYIKFRMLGKIVCQNYYYIHTRKSGMNFIRRTVENIIAERQDSLYQSK